MPNGEVIGAMVLRGERNEAGVCGESLRTEKQPDNQETEAVGQGGRVLMQAYTRMSVPKLFQIYN